MVGTRVLIITVAAILTGVVVGDYVQSRQELTVNKFQYVQTVCDIAHNEASGQSEQACGDAQDQTNTEYLCSKNYNVCWVEAK